jgi:hypothetical protein
MKTSFRAAAAVIAAAVIAASSVIAAAESKTVMTVNGVDISEERFKRECDWVIGQKGAFHALTDSRRTELVSVAVDHLVVWEVIRGKLAAGIGEASEVEIVRKVDEDRKRWGDKFAGFLKMHGQTEESYAMRTRDSLNYLRYMADYARGKSDIPDADVETFYRDRFAQYNPPNRFELSALRMSDNVHYRQDGGAMASAAAGELLESIRKGMTFEAAVTEAKKRELDAAVLTETVEAGVRPDYDAVLGKLANKGDLSPVFKEGANTWTILRLEDRRTFPARPLVEVREEIRRQLSRSRESQICEAHAAEMRKQAQVVYLDTTLRPTSPAQ